MVEPTPFGEIALVLALAAAGDHYLNANADYDDEELEGYENLPRIKGADRDKGGTYRTKTKGANTADKQTIGDVARETGVDRRGFGKYVDRIKKTENRATTTRMTN